MKKLTTVICLVLLAGCGEDIAPPITEDASLLPCAAGPEQFDARIGGRVWVHAGDGATWDFLSVFGLRTSAPGYVSGNSTWCTENGTLKVTPLDNAIRQTRTWEYEVSGDTLVIATTYRLDFSGYHASTSK